MSNATDRVFRTFEDAVETGVVGEIERGGARASEFDILGLAQRIVRKSIDGFVIQTGGRSFWEIAEDFAV